MDEAKLLHLLKKKKGFFEAILELSEDEADLSVEEWMAVLEQKKILLSCIDEIDAELNPFKQRFHMLSQEVSDEIEKIRRVILEILQRDTVNQEQRKWALNPNRVGPHDEP